MDGLTHTYASHHLRLVSLIPAAPYRNRISQKLLASNNPQVYKSFIKKKAFGRQRRCLKDEAGVSDTQKSVHFSAFANVPDVPVDEFIIIHRFGDCQENSVQLAGGNDNDAMKL